MILRTMLNLRGGRKLPVVMQSERAECGLACVAMLAGFHGQQQDLSTLRNRFPPSQHGATLAELMHLATAMNMSARAIRCDINELADCETPLILHWDFNHYVVLKKTTKHKIIIHDPAVGLRGTLYQRPLGTSPVLLSKSNLTITSTLEHLLISTVSFRSLAIWMGFGLRSLKFSYSQAFCKLSRCPCLSICN